MERISDHAKLLVCFDFFLLLIFFLFLEISTFLCVVLESVNPVKLQNFPYGAHNSYNDLGFCKGRFPS